MLGKSTPPNIYSAILLFRPLDLLTLHAQYILSIRVLSGVITTYSSFKNVFFIAAGTQFLTFALMWAALPDYPKKATGLNYFQILWR